MTQIAEDDAFRAPIQSTIAQDKVRPNDRQLREVLKHATWDEQRRVFD